MVQQKIDKFNEYRFINSGTNMATGEKQQPTSTKKVPLRDLSKETSNIASKPPANLPLPKDQGPISDAVKVSGIKRQEPCKPSSPSRTQPPGSTGANRHLVYVRRKLETEPAKMDGSDSRGLRKSGNNYTSEPMAQTVLPRVQEEQAREGNSPSVPLYAPVPPVPPVSLNASSGLSAPAPSLGKPATGVAVPAPNYSTVTTAVPVQPVAQRPSDQHWKERFVRLQMFLKSCDQSSQEEYIRRLRSLTATARSQHAYELEERAIHLLFEEGKELHRMRILNVLGKASPDGHASASTQIHSPVQMASEK